MQSQKPFQINCDLGEGIQDENQLIPWIDAASIACGGHFGDKVSIAATLRLVRKYGKKAGAHPSYPDLNNFGRKTLDLSPIDLIQSLSGQIDLFLQVADAENIPIDHIKFHGALYNDAVEKPELAVLLVDFLKVKYPEIPLFVPPHSQLEKAALEAQMPIRLEIFGDRAYQSNYQLVARKVENSLFTQTAQVLAHLDEILLRQQIKTLSGELIPIQAETVCFHGDNSGILEFLPQVRNRFWQ